MSETIAQFIFEVMCQYGCIFQLTVDNGSEFKGATQVLMDKCKAPIVQTSVYNPKAKGKVEQGHGVWIESMWRVLKGKMDEWPSLMGYALWADQVTMKKNTDYSPYFLLYGQYPLMPFDVTDQMLHPLHWPSVTIMKELLAMRICQLMQCEEYLDKSAVKNFEARNHAAQTYNQRHSGRMRCGEYKPGEFVLASNECQHFQHDLKCQPRWFGPYIVVKHRESGAFILQELDGTLMKQPIAWKHIKLYHYRRNTEPVMKSLLTIPEDEEETDHSHKLDKM